MVSNKLSILKILLSTLLFLLLMVQYSHAKKNDQLEQAKQIVGSLINEVTITDETGLVAEDYRAIVENIYTSNFDEERIAHFTLGSEWKNLDEQQKQDYIVALRSHVVNSYSSQFKTMSGYQITVNDARFSRKGGYIFVTSKATKADLKNSVKMSWRLDTKTLKIVDISIEDISMVMTKRDEFASFLKNNSIDSLIDQLASS
jgi:phospholipid transport system substrate-binding protein